MNRADIEAEIGIPPGDASFLLDKSTAPLVRQWLTTFGWSADRANAARHSTLERIYRYPRELDYFRRRGEYNTNLRGKDDAHNTAKAPDRESRDKDLRGHRPNARDNNLDGRSNDNGRSEEPAHSSSDRASETRGNPSLTDTIAGIVCGEYSDDDVLSLFRACKAHLGV